MRPLELHRAYTRAAAEQQRMASACRFCDYRRGGLLLEEARASFVAHACTAAPLGA